MPITNESELVAAVEALVPPAKVFNNTGEQINTGLDDSAGRVVQPAKRFIKTTSDAIFNRASPAGARTFVYRLNRNDNTTEYVGEPGSVGGVRFFTPTRVLVYAGSASAGVELPTLPTDFVGELSVSATVIDNGDGTGTLRAACSWDAAIVSGAASSVYMGTLTDRFRLYTGGGNTDLIEYVDYDDSVSDADLSTLTTENLPDPYTYLRPFDGSLIDISASDFGSVSVPNYYESYSEGGNLPNTDGYGVCTNRGNIIIPRKANGDLITEGVVTGLTFDPILNFTGPIKYQLTDTAGDLSLPDFGTQDYPKALVDNDDEGGWHESTTFNLADFTKNTQPAQIDPSVPTLYTDNFAAGGGYIVCNGADLTTDIKDYLGIAEPSIKITELTSGSKVLINGVATTIAGTEHTTPTLAAFADYEIRIAHPDKKSIILSTFVSAGLKEITVTQEDLTVPLTHNGSLLTQFALNGNVLEVTDDDDTFDIQLAEAWLRYNDFTNPDNPWFDKHHLVHPAQLVVDKDMEQIVNTKITACEVTNGVITKNVVTSPYSVVYGGFTINGVFQGEGL